VRGPLLGAQLGGGGWKEAGLEINGDAMRVFGKPALALGLFVLAAGQVVPARAGDEEQVVGGIKYACTGVGEESRQDPRWPSYPFRLTFAAAGGLYLADVDVTVRDAAGAEVIRIEGCYAPWLLIDLPPGTYRVDGVARETHRRSTTVAITAGRQTKAVLRFPEITE
jgi:hypothetical protein